MTKDPNPTGDQFSTTTSPGSTKSGQAGSTGASPTMGTASAAPPYPNQRESAGSSGSVVDQAAQKAGDIADQAKQTVAQATDQAREQVTSRLDDQINRAAEGLGGVAQALRQASQQVQEQNQGAFRQYIDTAADQVERLSGYLRSNDLGQIVGQVEDFARRQPALFLGGAFVLGLFGARFLKSSSPRSSDRYGSAPRGSGSAGSEDYYYTRGTTYGRGYGEGSRGGYQGGYRTPSGPRSSGYTPPGTGPTGGGSEL